jgi:hypothetical protein
LRILGEGEARELLQEAHKEQRHLMVCKLNNLEQGK